MINRKFTVKPDPIDERDYKFKSTKYQAKSNLPSEVDLRDHMSPIVDQGSLGSCTANAIASGLREYLQIKDGKPLTRLSRLYLYWHERFLEGSVDTDAGAYIRDGFKVLLNRGCAPEVDFPYFESTFKNTPSDIAEQNSAKFKIEEYHRVTDLLSLQQALAEGLPVVIGFTVYDSFLSSDVANRGMVPMPKTGENVWGGHAVLAVGYKTFSDGSLWILCRNSWGNEWGQFGYFWLPEGYFTDRIVNDMWTGTTNYIAPRLSVDESIDLLAKRGIFDSPDFWKNLSRKYENDPSSDFRFVGLAFQKIANYIQDVKE